MAIPSTPFAPLMEAFKPSPALAAFITDIWVWEIPSAPSSNVASTLTLLPDGHPTMCFVHGTPLTASDGRNSFVTRSAVCGFQARPVHVTCDGRAAGITVRFKPWSLSSFFPASLEEAAERRIDCRDVFARADVEDLESELHELTTSAGRVCRVERFLLALLRAREADRLVEQAVTHICAGRHATPVGRMASELGATERTLERRFRRVIGASPKMFARVMRLQAALARPDRPAKWSELALEGGFYDQAHFNRETRELFGTSPSTLVSPLANPIARGFRSLGEQTSLSATIFR